MNNNQYRMYTNKKKRKGKKLLIVLICIAAVCLAGLAVIGLTVGEGSISREDVSLAVSENIELKKQISEQQEQIDTLNKKIDDLTEELNARPTIEPTPYAPPNAAIVSPSPSPNAAPRS